MITATDKKLIQETIEHYLCDDFKDNQAIFDREEKFANYCNIDLDMVMEKVINALKFIR